MSAQQDVVVGLSEGSRRVCIVNMKTVLFVLNYCTLYYAIKLISLSITAYKLS